MRKLIDLLLLIIVIFFLQNLYKYVDINVSKLFTNIICIIILSIYIFYQNYASYIKNIFRIDIRNLIYIIPLIVYSLVMFTNFKIEYYNYDLFKVKELRYIFFEKLTSVTIEELLFRVITFFSFLSVVLKMKNEVFKSALYCNILFGALHFVNYFTQNMDLYSVIAQVFGAFSVGFLFTLIFLKTKSLLLCVTIHFLINLNTALSTYYLQDKIVSVENSDGPNVIGLVFITIIYLIPFFISLVIIKIKPLEQINLQNHEKPN